MHTIGRALGTTVVAEGAERAVRRRDSTGLYHGQLSVRRINGSVFEAEVRSSLFQSASGELMASTILRDPTELRRSRS